MLICIGFVPSLSIALGFPVATLRTVCYKDVRKDIAMPSRNHIPLHVINSLRRILLFNVPFRHADDFVTQQTSNLLLGLICNDLLLLRYNTLSGFFQLGTNRNSWVTNCIFKVI